MFLDVVPRRDDPRDSRGHRVADREMHRIIVRAPAVTVVGAEPSKTSVRDDDVVRGIGVGSRRRHPVDAADDRGPLSGRVLVERLRLPETCAGGDADEAEAVVLGGQHARDRRAVEVVVLIALLRVDAIRSANDV